MADSTSGGQALRGQGLARRLHERRFELLDQAGVTVVIPGARNPEQARANAAVAGLPPLSEEAIAGVREVYDELIRPQVHDKW